MIGRIGTAGETAQKLVAAGTRFENATARQVLDLKHTYSNSSIHRNFRFSILYHFRILESALKIIDFKSLKDCCKGKDTEARSCNDHDCFDGMGVYGEADEYAYLQYGNGDDLGDFLGKYNLDPPKLPGTTPTHFKNNFEIILPCLTFDI